MGRASLAGRSGPQGRPDRSASRAGPGGGVITPADSIGALAANGIEKINEKQKLSSFRVQYTVQPVPDDTMVRVAPVNAIQMSLVSGFLIAIPQSVR